MQIQRHSIPKHKYIKIFKCTLQSRSSPLCIFNCSLISTVEFNGTDNLFFSFSAKLLLILILVMWSPASHSFFPLFDDDYLEIANCSDLTIVFYLLGNFGQALLIRSCHEDVILTRKSHNWTGIAFIQGDSAGGSKLIEQTLPGMRAFQCVFSIF